jgi:RHS repeat-associated protein
MTTVYDAAGRLTAELLGSGRRNPFSYDQASRRTVTADPTGVYTTTYDDRGQPLTVSQPGDKRITYVYDAAGRRARMTDPDGGRFTYAYDAAGRLAHLVNPQDERSTFAYDPAGRQIRQQSANGTLTTQIYDAANHLTDLLHAKSDGTLVSRLTYTYDPVGNRTGVLEADGSRTTWSYDNTYQLTAEHRTAGTNWESLSLDDWSDLTLSAWDTLPLGDPNATFRTTYTYDPAGNRLLMNDSGVRTTYSFDAANEILWQETPTGRTTYTHDAAGNRTTKETTDGVTTYTWDEDNRLTAAQLPTSARHTFAYNADGKRVTREDSSGVAKYIRDFDRILQQTDAAGDTEREYTAAPNDFGDLISEHDGAASTYHHYDALGTTNVLTAGDQGTTDRYLHRAFGQLITHDGQSITPFLFIGREGYFYEPALALHYVNARWYDPTTGRWLSEDPIGYQGGLNLFGYVSNSSTSATDPSGLIPPGTLATTIAPFFLVGPDVPARPGFTVLVDSDASKGIRGGTLWLGIEMYQAGALRLEYDKLVRDLEQMGLSKPEAKAARNAIKEQIRARQNDLAKAVTNRILKARAEAGYKSSMNSPFKPNAGVTGMGKVMCVAGKGMIVVSVTLDVVNIATTPADERGMEIAKTGGRWAGAMAGGKLGALACAWGGPWGVGICGFAGAVGGAILGEKAIELLNTPNPVDDPVGNLPGVQALRAQAKCYAAETGDDAVLQGFLP